VKSFYGLPGWPDGEASLDLGHRRLITFPLPGHQASHIAIYDEMNKWLLTGDSLYPGLLVVQDWIAYRASNARLAEFAQSQAEQRSPILPDVPTAKEVGLPQFQVLSWVALFAPKATPIPILDKLTNAIVDVEAGTSPTSS
jgi:hypothetical protein